MKPSKYNFFYKYEENGENYIAYNSFSNALALLTNSQYCCFQNFQKDSSYRLEDKFVEELKKGNFIIDDEANELELIRERMLKCRYNTTTLGITIAPTLDCNLRCVYCYEKGCEKKGVMSKDIQDKIVEYVRRQVSTISQLSVNWYGGEPLLAIDVIESLTEHFLKICKENNITYSSTIITNGYLLNMETVNRLIECKISNCQVTIDGDKKTHNLRRPHVSGKDTYDTILKNAFNACKWFSVSIRVNLDKENLDSIFFIRDIIKRNKLANIIVYPAPIRDNNECYIDNACLKCHEFFNYEYQYILSVGEERDILRKYPVSHGNFCCADSLNTLVIGEDGRLYKCWSDIGRKDLCFGNICDDSYNIFKAIRYSKYDPTRDIKCKKCKFLPICMGGCPRDVYDRSNDRCLHFEELHEKYLRRITAVIEQKQEEIK